MFIDLMFYKSRHFEKIFLFIARFLQRAEIYYSVQILTVYMLSCYKIHDLNRKKIKIDFWLSCKLFFSYTRCSFITCIELNYVCKIERPPEQLTVCIIVCVRSAIILILECSNELTNCCSWQFHHRGIFARRKTEPSE